MSQWRLPPEILAGVVSNLERSEDWQALLRHFELSTTFGLVVLLVPDRYVAYACRTTLQRRLEEAGDRLLEVPIASPTDLEQLAAALVTLDGVPRSGAVWVEAAIAESLPDHQQWRSAWRSAAAGLNQVRNTLRERFACSLVFVGAPWLQEVLRELAPDLWSVRTLVAYLTGASLDGAAKALDGTLEQSDERAESPARAPDPDLALEEARRLEGHDEESRAELLLRAARGFEALGRLDEALSASEEAVRIRRQLAAQRPDAFLPDLAGSLNNLGNRLSDLGRREDALAATEEAVRIRRQLAAERTDAFLPDLARSLNNLGTRLSDLGRREDALAATEEAVRIYRQLAAERPDAFLPDLAMSLNNLGSDLNDLGRREDALAATEGAVRIRRQLAVERPDAFLPGLAMSLGARGSVLRSMNNPAAAAASFREGIELLNPLYRRLPSAFEPLMTALVRDYLAACEQAGQTPDLPE